MCKTNLSAAELIDQSEDFKFKLIFIESAVRSMIQTGNMSESYIGDGLSSVMLLLVSEYENLQQIIESLILSRDDSAASNLNDSVELNGKDKKT